MKTTKFWQFHLSTAVVMVLVAGVLLRLDLHWRDVGKEQYPEVIFEMGGGLEAPSNFSTITWQGLGWPMTFDSRALDSDNEVRSLKTIRTANEKTFNESALAVDVIIAIVLLLFTAIVCEWLICYRVHEPVHKDVTAHGRTDTDDEVNTCPKGRTL